ncbi:queuine tRNA-ribosyltransferase [Mitosporidium daphniae]|uniref:Queuine tRNA-ribosyltransferase catalytic subunit 1 n=1 Tax=Mitosporidium daphniae TaxID=1485682 RepID=A0A098VRU4_9MICR|nr:queuine tRNA-ribosyltransferase [Mitosporidium daphniae]KGG50421.1 queuine tRNA-ribosyltransferase [Mitosporidium daphniae]|eukprot:XP_013236908.1 queuine tRNA-ribosyltransferase [Mitosporidium daphniae]
MAEPPLRFAIVARCSTTRARASLMHLPHGTVKLPVFMPVGTQGTMKGLTADQLRELDCEILLSNTYHLGNRPGVDILSAQGGLHKFMDWDRAILTDSGGFQMVSLQKLSTVSEEGVTFESPHDGSMMLLRPEDSIAIQREIGSDIVMQLDDVVNPLSPPARLQEAMERSIHWLDRAIASMKQNEASNVEQVSLANAPPGKKMIPVVEALSSQKAVPARQTLFPIIQGGLDLTRRDHCITEMKKRSTLGYAIGGLGGGEAKSDFTAMIRFCTKELEGDGSCPSTPIYCMGIGYDLDLLICVALGVDMFDCVFPTRTARFGHALHPCGDISLKKAMYAQDLRPIDSECTCLTCRNYTRAALHGIVGKETTGCHLLSMHNIAYMLRFSRAMRDAIIADKFPAYIKSFLRRRFIENEEQLADKEAIVPEWIIDALASIGLVIDPRMAE